MVNKRLIDFGVEKSKMPKTIPRIVGYVKKKLMGGNDFICHGTHVGEPKATCGRKILKKVLGVPEKSYWQIRRMGAGSWWMDLCDDGGGGLSGWLHLCS